MIENSGINYSNEEKPEKVECHECENKVNKAQIHDDVGVCMGCYYRRKDEYETMTRHENLERSDAKVSGQENKIREWKKQVGEKQ